MSGGGGRAAYFTGPGLSVWLPSGMHLEKNGCRFDRHCSSATKSLNQVFREADLCSSCGCSYSIAVATIGVWIKTGCSEETLGGFGDIPSCEKGAVTQSEERTTRKELL